jgi:acyl-CoA thioesterase FadM
MTEPTAWTAAPSAPSDLDPGLTGRPDRPVPGIENGYLAGYRVRFDEAGPDGVVRTSAYLRYAQDIAWRHSEDRGFDRAWYAQQGRWWVVRAVDLEVRTPVLMGRTIRLATAVVGHRRIWARRHGEARAVDGTLAAVIDTDWVIVDGRGRIVRIPEDFGEAFPNPEIEGEILRADRTPEPADVSRMSIRVRPQDLDPMGHVNNAVYLDWIDEALDAAGLGEARRLPRRLRMEYAASAGPGDEVEVRTWLVDDGWNARLLRAADGSDLVRAAGSPA